MFDWLYNLLIEDYKIPYCNRDCFYVYNTGIMVNLYLYKINMISNCPCALLK